MLIAIDGRIFRDPSEAKVPVLDHGFLFGDSVYEVVRTFGGRAFEVGPHLARLFRSARHLALDVGRTPEQLTAEIDELLAAAAIDGEAYIRLIITRGVGELTLDPASCLHATRIFIVKPLLPWPAAQYEQGVKLELVSVVRNEPGTVDPSLKTGNYLNNVLAMIEARKAQADEAIMLNRAGFLTEGTTSNLFFVKGGKLFTPSLESGILSGITRSDVIRLAREQGIPVREGDFPKDDLFGADEAFITSTTRGAMPVLAVSGRRIGDGKRPVTDRIRSLLQAEADQFIASTKG